MSNTPPPATPNPPSSPSPQTASTVGTSMAMVNMNNLLNGKDSRWLQLEVCREFQRNKCTRPDTECKFAHPPANVEVQNGRVTACYDSIKTFNPWRVLHRAACLFHPASQSCASLHLPVPLSPLPFLEDAAACCFIQT